MTGFNDLPEEILLHIFQFYLKRNNQQYLLSRLSNVCKLWEAVCQSNVLWMKFDGTVPYATMMTLHSKGCLNSTKDLTISNIECLTDIDAAKLFYGLENVEILNFSQVAYFSKNVIDILAQSDLKLKEIQLGNKKQSKKARFIRYLDFIPFFSSKGKYLTTLKVSYYTVKNAVQFLKCLSENCPNLEHLNFTNNYCAAGMFPLKYFQMNCPKLKILHLDNSIGIQNMGTHSLGFPNLEVFTYNDLDIISHVRDKDLKNILFNSPNLKFLSLNNCSISVEVLCSLPADSLEYLFLSRSKVVNANNLSDIFKKWVYTLKQVDISYSNNKSVNDAVLILTTLPNESPLEFLDLGYTQVQSDTVKRILEKCKQIQILNLTGCRNLTRGLKRNYSGKTELKTLFEKLEASAYDDSTDEEISM